MIENCTHCNLDTAGQHEFDCPLNPNSFTIDSVSNDTSLCFNGTIDAVDTIECSTSSCKSDITVPSSGYQAIVGLKAMQEGWYINDKGQFLCPECKKKLIGGEMPKKVIITTNLIYDVHNVILHGRSVAKIADIREIDGIPIVHYADEQDANIAKMNYRDKGYEVKMVMTEAGVEELLKGEQE